MYIAIMGYGVVGSGVAEVLEKNRSRVEKAVGEEIKIKYMFFIFSFNTLFKYEIIKKVLHLKSDSL